MDDVITTHDLTKIYVQDFLSFEHGQSIRLPPHPRQKGDSKCTPLS